MKNNSTHRNPNLYTLYLLIGCALALMTGCSTPHQSRVESSSAAETHEVVDEAGRRVRVPLRLERIVSLAPNLTEIVYAVGAGDRLVGDTTYCDYPPEARQVAKVGDTLHPSIERIIALHPQLILVSTASQLEAFTGELYEQGIVVYITDPHDLDGVFRSIKGLGDLLGEHERGEKLVSALEARASSVTEAIKGSRPVTVFYQLSAEPLYTAGHDSFVTDLIRRAGGKSVTENVPGAWPRYSDESALAANPEAVIMAAGGSMGEANSEIAAALRKSPAALNGRVYRIDGDYLSRPGPRLVEGLEQIARSLHPEVFRQG